MLEQSFVFGPFVLNPQAGTLLRQGEPLPVGYRAFRLLTAFLESPGEVPTKHDLIDAAREGTAVEEGTLSVQSEQLKRLRGQAQASEDRSAAVRGSRTAQIGAPVARGSALAPASRAPAGNRSGRTGGWGPSPAAPPTC